MWTTLSIDTSMASVKINTRDMGGSQILGFDAGLRMGCFFFRLFSFEW